MLYHREQRGHGSERGYITATEQLTVLHGEFLGNSWVLIVFTENLKTTTTITLLSIKPETKPLL